MPTPAAARHGSKVALLWLLAAGGGGAAARSTRSLVRNCEPAELPGAPWIVRPVSAIGRPGCRFRARSPCTINAVERSADTIPAFRC
jgi:hypothetical protein